MPERERPSLSGLSIKRPLPDRGKPVVSIDQAESALLGDAPAAPPVAPAAMVAQVAVREQAAVPPDVHLGELMDSPTTVQSTVLSPSLLKARKKPVKIAWTFKIPLELHQELTTVAAHNRLTMSDIVIEAIQFHLPNFPHPSKNSRT
jgi:hypothetical protein